ncbi:MAG: transglutaminase-like domain-containing protein [Candidatus Nanoarchaeia archaeon]
MKKLMVIVTALILLQIATAAEESYSKYSSLDLNIEIFTTIQAEKKSSKASIESLQADLELFPINTDDQEVLSLDVKTEPQAEVEKGERKITITWEEPQKYELTYNVNSDVRTYNKIKKITSKVDFPIQELEPEERRYTMPSEYIDINDQIKQKAAEIAEGETDLYMVTYKVGEWVRKNIKYDLNTLTATVVQKSSWVLTNKEGVCDEITNLYISMMRSLGVPTRFVSGVVYSNVNYQFENHGWAEVYMPGQGWIPVDVTFGQYGWVDPGHVKMQDSLDSGEASVTYTSRTRGVEIKTTPPDIKTRVLKKGGEVKKLAKLKVAPLEDEVAFGSYTILEVEAENTQDYYLPLSFTLTKAPQTVEKNPSIHTVLKPREKKKFYWTLKTPDNLDSNYIYIADIEVTSNFAETAESEIKYGPGFKKYTKEWAEQILEMLTERENKILFTNIELKCETDKEMYTSSENAKITCMVRNLGNKNLDKINVCIKDQCNETKLTIAEQREIEFEIELRRNETLTVTAETEKYIKQTSITLNVQEIPDIKIVAYEPKKLGYNEETTLNLTLLTRTKAKDIRIIIKNVGEITIEELEGSYTIEIPVKGKQFRRGFIQLHMEYSDESGDLIKRDEENLELNILNLPWYAELLNYLKI